MAERVTYYSGPTAVTLTVSVCSTRLIIIYLAQLTIPEAVKIFRDSGILCLVHLEASPIQTRKGTDSDTTYDNRVVHVSTILSPLALAKGEVLTKVQAQSKRVEPVEGRMNKGFRGWWHHVGTTE